MEDAITQEYEQLQAEVEFQQTKLSESWENATQQFKDLTSSVKWRSLIAILFRGVFILGGFAISLGLPGAWPRIVGAAVTLVGLIDNQWLFNHEILMFKTPARNAFRKLLDKIAHDFTEAFSPFPKSESTSAARNERVKDLVSNVKRARAELFNGSERIKDALDNKELGVLQKLAIQPDTTPSTKG